MASKYVTVIGNFLKHSANKPGFNRSTVVWKPILIEEGRLRVEFQVTEDLTNPFNTLHGGITATFIDIGTTAAIIATPRGVNGVSVSLNVNYLAPAKQGETVVMDAWVSRMGRTLAYAEAELFRKSDNVMIAKAMQTKAFPETPKDNSYMSPRE